MRAAAVVINHNGGEDLARCLEALRGQTVPVDIVLVDCASTDGSRGLAERPPDGVKGLPLAANLGYAGGCQRRSRGARRRRRGGRVSSTRTAFPSPASSRRRSGACGGDPGVGGVAARLVRPGGEVLDSCGQVLTPWLLRVRDRGYGSPAAGAFLGPAVVLAACGAGMVYRRAALEAVGGGGAGLPGRVLRVLGGPRPRVAGERRGVAGACTSRRPWRCTAAAATAAPGSGRLVFRRPPARGGGDPRQPLGDAGCATCTRLISGGACPYCCRQMLRWSCWSPCVARPCCPRWSAPCPGCGSRGGSGRRCARRRLRELP